jgi:hypothetical protein
MPTRNRNSANDIQSKAADIVGQDAAQDAADAPAEQGDRDDRAGIGRDLRKLRRLEQLAQRHPDGEDQGEGFIAIEHPAHVGGDERLPLGAGERAVPGSVGAGGDAWHGLLPFEFSGVTAGLVPAVSIRSTYHPHRDGRDKPGHDAVGVMTRMNLRYRRHPTLR